MGPQKGGNGILGRYGIHSTWPERNTGTTVTGVVVRDCNSHAFVPT